VTQTPLSAGETTDQRNNVRLYVGVLVVEAVVLLAIWLFQRYFGA
jgi:hypothetical protein